MRRTPSPSIVRALVVVPAALGLPHLTLGVAVQAQPADGWPMAGGDAAHTATAPAPAPPYREAWSAEIPGGAVAGPVADADRVVVVAKGHVLALSTDDGSEAWRVDRDEGPAGSAVIAGELVVYAEGSGRTSAVVAVQAEDGSEAWRTEAGSAMPGAILAAGETVVIAGREGTVRAFDVSTGAESWEREIEGRIETSPASDGESIFVVSEDERAGTGTMHALDPATGRERWTFTPEGIGAPVSSPAVVGDLVVAVLGPRVRALDTGRGQERWATRLRWLPSPRLMPAVPGDVIVGDASGHVYRFDAGTGEERWLFRLPDDLLRGSPVVAGNAVVIGHGGGELAAIDLDRGHLVWRHDLGDGGVTASAVAGGRLYGSLEGGPVVAFEADPGGSLLDEPSPTTLYLGPAIVSYAATVVPMFLLLLAAFRLLGRREPPPATRGEEPT